MYRTWITVGAFAALTFAVSGIAQTDVSRIAPDKAWGVDALAAACIDGMGPGSGLLSISHRIESCTLLAEIDGQAYTGLYNRARARQSVQDWQEAEADFTAALRVDPDAAEALFERGRVRLLYLGMPELALADLDLAGELAPDRPAVQLLKAQAAIALARSGAGEEIGAMIDTAQSALTRYLSLTEGAQDITVQVQRDAAQDLLDRLAQNEAQN